MRRKTAAGVAGSFGSSVGYYDALAGAYSERTADRRRYLDAVDGIVLGAAPRRTEAYLDAGCGDGRRAKLIAEAVAAGRLALVDESSEMLGLARHRLSGTNADFFCGSAKDYRTHERFDLITCLWNVFGHICDRDDRVATLAALGRLLTPGGRIVCDVNNRYNIREYGLRAVAANFVGGFFGRKEAGRFNLRHCGAGCTVYIHSPREFEKTVEDAGLRVIGKVGVGYGSGAVERTRMMNFTCQLVYVISRRSGVLS